jgi:hypothetical protein
LARPVDVTYVENLHAKLEQIGADNTKGTIISRGDLTKHALEYAKTKGLGVARLFERAITNVASYTTLDERRQDQKQMWELSQSLNKDLDNVLQGQERENPDIAFRRAMSFRTFFGYLSVGIPEVAGTLHSYLHGELLTTLAVAIRNEKK